MELLTEPKSAYLLEAGIEILHSQSNEWLSEIAFWRDESAFLYALIVSRTLKDVPVNSEKLIQNIENELVKITGGELDELQKAVELHEGYLSRLLESKREDQENYRDQHRQIAARFDKFESRYKTLKKEVFELVELIKNGKEKLNETIKLINERRAVRKYKSKTVSKKLVEQILDAGRMAPSAINKQPWKFYILTDKEMIKSFSKEIAKAAAKEMVKTGVKELIKSPPNVFHLLHEMDFKKVSDPIFHGAPVVVFLTSPRSNEWAPLDIGMCAQNMMLAAKALGLNSCPVGLGKFVEKTKIFSKLNVPKTEQVNLSLVFGYGDETPLMKERVKNNAIYL